MFFIVFLSEDFVFAGFQLIVYLVMCKFATPERVIFHFNIFLNLEYRMTNDTTLLNNK